MKHISIFFSALFLLAASCGTEPEDGNLINLNIKLLKKCCENANVTGDIFLGSQKENKIIYGGVALGHLLINSYAQIVEDSIYIPQNNTEIQGTSFSYLSSQNMKSDFLIVISAFSDVSLGYLYEYDISENRVLLLKDSTWQIGSAVYWHGDDSKLVYYSYGNDDGLEAGYYLYNKTTDSDSLLLAHRSPAGPSEVLNGFDLSADNSTLLYPDVQATPNTSALPQIIEYDLLTQQADTLDIQFQPSNRIGLWMRYSPDGSEILYVNFPFGALRDVSGGTSEVGLIDVATKTKRILDVNTNDRNDAGSVQLTANWSPDGEHIIYGSGRFFLPEGVVGTYSLYILKNVHNPENFK